MAFKGTTGGGTAGLLKQFFISLGLQTDVASFLTAFELVKVLDGGLKALAIGLGHALGGVISFASEVSQLGQDLAMASAKTGLTTQDLQELGYAAGLTGVSFNRLTSGFGIFLRHADELAHGVTSQGAKGLAALGVTADDVNKKAPADLFRKWLDAFNQLPTAADRSRAAFTAFGRSGQELIPFFAMGSQAIDEAKKEFIAFGGVLDDAEVKLAQTANRDIKRLNGAFGALKVQIGAGMLPVFDGLVKSVLTFIKENKTSIISGMTTAFKALGAVLKVVWDVMKNVFYATRALWRDLKALADILGPTGTKLVAASAAMALLGASGLGAAITFGLTAGSILLLIAVLEDLVVGAKGGKSVIFGLWSAFSNWWDAWVNSASAGMPNWLTYLKEFFGLITGNKETWDNAIKSWKEALSGFFVWLGDQLEQVWNNTIGQIPFLKLGGKSLIDEARENLPTLDRLAHPKMSDLWSNPEAHNPWSLSPDWLFATPFDKGGPVNVAPATVNITVNAGPGMDTKDLVTDVKKQFFESYEAEMRRTWNVVKGAYE